MSNAREDAVASRSTTAALASHCAALAEKQSKGEAVELELIPGLPSEWVVEFVLSKLSWQQLATLSAVSRGWSSVIRSRAVYEARVRTNSRQKLLAALHRVPAEDVDGGSLPSFIIKQLFADEEEASMFFTSFDDSFTYTLDEDGDGTSCPVGFTYALSLHNPSDNTWQQLPLVPNDREYGISPFSELACIKGKLFVIGGRDQETWEPHRNVYMLDLVAGGGVWQQCASMISARASFACGVIEDKVYVAGGHSDICRALSTGEVYDPERDVWEMIADMHGPRSCCTVAILDKCMYVIGGYALAGENEEFELVDDGAGWASSAEVYDSCTREWKQLENLKNEYSAQACTVYDGALYSFSTLGVEKFESATNTWTELYEESWCISGGDGTVPCLILSVATVDKEIYAMVCIGDDCNQGCTFLKSKGFGKLGPKLWWERVTCPVKFVGAFPTLCAVEV